MWRKTQTKESVDVCIPAYASSSFIHETLKALQKQTYPHFRVEISVDGNDEKTYEACRPFLNDNRFHLFIQKERLGWIQNTNWLLSRVTSRFVFLLPHG